MFWLTLICGFMAVGIIILLFKIHLIKKSAREIKKGFAEKLSEDTNTIIDISSGDKDMCALAETINIQLRQLREERLRFQQGDTELKDAVINISHDLRTPLTAICGYLELLEHEEKSLKAKEYLKQICGRTDVMKQLTEELFRYSIISSVKKNVSEKICLNSILEESIASCYGAIRSRGITPEIDITDVHINRVLDKSALMRIFDNIISNVLKYSDGDFFVKLTDDGVMTFANTARKLDPVLVEKLFDRFYTVETARNSTGLGLSIAKLLTEQMDGVIRAEYEKKMIVITLEFK